LAQAGAGALLAIVTMDVEVERLSQLVAAQHQQIMTLVSAVEIHTSRLNLQAQQLEFQRLQLRAGLLHAQDQQDKLRAFVFDLRQRLYDLWSWCTGFNNSFN